MTVSINPIERRTIPEVRVGARAPENDLNLRTVECNAQRYVSRVEPGRDLVTLKNVDRPVSLRIHFQSGTAK